MELLNTLISRHSVRTYNGEPLLSSDLEKILKAAKAAPVGLGLYDQIIWFSSTFHEPFHICPVRYFSSIFLASAPS